MKNYENINTALNKDNVWDFKLGGTWDIMGSGWILGAFWVGTSEKDFFTTAENPPRGAGQERLPRHGRQDVLKPPDNRREPNS